MSYDVISVGSAVQDVFLIGKSFRPGEFDGEEMLALPLGAKVDVEDIIYDTGGGASNSAVTFARAGLRTACVAKLGIDGPGREILHTLRQEGVSDEHIIQNSKHHTGFSTIIVSPGGERTILSHHGAGYQYSKHDFALDGTATKWVYITTLAGDLLALSNLLDWAGRNGFQVAINPGELELAKPTRLLRLLRRADVVMLNIHEAHQLVGHDEPEDIFKACRRAELHTIVLTDGPNGSWVLDGSYIYRTELYKKVVVVDRTGAGDAYGSGFIASIIKGESIEQAMTYASANATSVIGYIGAKAGILRHPIVKFMNVTNKIVIGRN